MSVPKKVQIVPNIVHYVERDKDGISLHYPKHLGWTIYLGEKLVYRRPVNMCVIHQAWEAKASIINDVISEIENGLNRSKKKTFTVTVNGQSLPLRLQDALLLRGELLRLLGVLSQEEKTSRQQSN